MAILRTPHFSHELSPADAFTWFRSHQFYDIPPYFLTHWKTGKRFFYTPKGILAFEETPSEFVVAGEPLSLGGAEDQVEVVEIFDQMARRQQKGVCGYYVGDQWRSPDFAKVCLGTSSRIKLQGFDLDSPRAKEVRRALRKGEELNYEVIPVKHTKDYQQAQVSELHKKWRASRLFFTIRFLLSKPNMHHLVSDYEEWFAVEKDGQIIAFCSLFPYLREGELCFYVDNIIHDPQRDPHALTFLLSYLIMMLKEEGVEELNLGLSPFAKAANKSSKGPIERFFSLMYKVPVVYKAKGLHFFKNKFGGEEDPEYCFFNKRQSQWWQLAGMAGVTFLAKTEE